MSRRLRAFKRWMRSQQIDCSNALQLFEDDNGISVKALCDLKVGDLVATIPKSSCLTIKTSAANEMIESACLSGPLGISVALMYERSLRSDSVWDGYLQLLPEKESVPLVWSLEEVDTLLIGTELHKIVKEDKTLLYEDWKECILPLIESWPLKLDPNSFGVEQYFAARSLVASRSFEIDDYHGFGMVPLADLFNHKTGAENVHFTSIASTSEYENDDDSNRDDERGNIDDDKPSSEDLGTGSSGHVMSHLHSNANSLSAIPGLNSLDANGVDCNSDNERDNIDDDKPSSEDLGTDDPPNLETIIVKEVKGGDEVFNTYGSMGNAALLHRYGFTELDNPFDIVNIDLNLVVQWIKSSFSNRYCRLRLSFWRRLGCSGCISQRSEYFEISSDGEPQLELLVLLYIIFLPEEVYHKLNNTTFSVENVDKSINVLLSAKINRISLPGTQEKAKMLLTDSVCGALVSLVDIRESFYGLKSVEDDIKTLKGCCRMREKKLYHSLVLRVSERMILKKLRIYASGARGRKAGRGSWKVKGRWKRSRTG